MGLTKAKQKEKAKAMEAVREYIAARPDEESVTQEEIVEATKFDRAAISRAFQELQVEAFFGRPWHPEPENFTVPRRFPILSRLNREDT